MARSYAPLLLPALAAAQSFHGLTWGTDQQPYLSTYRADGGDAMNCTTGVKVACDNSPCRASFGKGADDGANAVMFSMGDLFPTAGTILEFDASGAVAASSTVDYYLYGIEYMGVDGCTYAAVGVARCAGIKSDDDAPTSVHVGHRLGRVDAERSLRHAPGRRHGRGHAAGRPAGQRHAARRRARRGVDDASATRAEGPRRYSIVSSGTFANHLKLGTVYHVAAHSKGDGAAGAGHSAVFSIDVAAATPTLAAAVFAPGDGWCQADLCSAGNPIVSLAANTDATELTILAARQGLVEPDPRLAAPSSRGAFLKAASNRGTTQRRQTGEALGRRLDLYVATAALDADGLIVDGPLTELRNVSGYKTGTPDQPNFAGYGFAFPSTDGKRLRAALVPEADTLSLDLVDLALADASDTETLPWYQSAAPDDACFPLLLLPDADDE